MIGETTVKILTGTTEPETIEANQGRDMMEIEDNQEKGMETTEDSQGMDMVSGPGT